ncbi:hypothetical protein [Herbaspirillum rhizosphaerae]|uniref:hypothetical protein n=1 Tax=Herbaspirillum rhizosphaerae TaxID=346179 RepID=UPI0012ED026B|nr:hypothetical protein [Herbaspirillum rhizosphaerae]
MHKITLMRGNNKKLKIIFMAGSEFCKRLILKELNFAFDLGNLLKPASSLGKTLSRPSCAQSYPQLVWIVEKVVMKPLVRSPFQELH